MKKLLKQLICFVLCGCLMLGGIAVFPVGLKAEADNGALSEGVDWNLDSGVLTISGSGSTGEYRAVSGVKAPWYDCREEVLHIKIGEGITTVGIGSFQDFSNLLDVSLPQSLEKIDEMSFSGCNKLQCLSIPSKVKSVDASAFLECNILENISVDSGNAYYSDADGVLFNKDKTKLILYPEGKITEEYSVPQGVTEIGAYAFANCSELIRINIPDTVNNIGVGAFMNCRTLLSADIPEGVTAIRPNTFQGCSALYEVKLPSAVTAIGSSAFGKCGSLMKINIPNATKTIDNSAFSGSPNLTVHCEKDSFANDYCKTNSIDYYYSNLSSVYPVANWVFANVPHSGQRYARFDVDCSWEEAKLVCEMLGGHLATVTSAEEMATIRTLLSGATPSVFWLGASDAKTEGAWEWVTGEAFSYSLWSSGQPDDTGAAEDYLETWIHGESWNDNRLNGTNESRGFVCEFENFYIPRKTIIYNGNVYCVYDELVSWYTAYNVCENMGGHLATITSAEEQSVITELCNGSFYTAYWLGATDDSSEGTWKWVTGEPFSYTNWSSGEPNNANSKEHYLEQYYTWNDYIDNGYRGFICETEAQSYSPVATGYYNGNRYEVYSYNTSWSDAQIIAQNKGGHLATVTDAEENSYISNLYKDLNLADDYLNIGGYRYKHENDYRWVTGERFVYSDWNADEPSNNQFVENFVQIYRYSNGWNDIGNKGSHYDGSCFIVEYESPKQVLTLSNTDGTVLNRYKVQGGIPVDKPLKDYNHGYVAEWYKEPSLQNKWDFETDIITEDTVLYASWSADTCAVSFEPNGGECGTVSKDVVFGSEYGALPECSREGYEFMGWHADEACSVKVDENTIVSVADNHRLFAKWQAVTYTVTFESNGGEQETETKSVVYGEPYGELPLCTRSGSGFLGWYADPEFKKPVNENSAVNISGNHSLYADWSELTVTGLKLISKPTKTEYYAGDTLDPSGLIALATYEGGTTEEISADRLNYSITEFPTAGKKIVKASYGEKYVSFIVTVSNRVLTSVSVAALPDKLTYTVGESLDTTGLTLTTTYDNSGTKTVTDGFEVSCDLSSAGTKTVTVNYTENGVSVSTSYQITVNPKVAEPDTTILVDSVSVVAGETITVPFRIENNRGFMGFAIAVEYDSEAFTPVSVAPSAILENGTLNDSIGTAYEYLKIVYVGSDDVIGDGELFTVDFIANENASGSYTFGVSYLQPDTFNESLDNVVFECSDFEVTVSNAAVDQSVIFSGGFVEATAGTTVNVPVSVKNGIGINSFSFKISYNSDVMSFAGVSNGAVLADGKINSSVNADNEITLDWFGSPITSDGELFYVTFEIDGDVQSEEMLAVLCENAAFANGTEKDIICSDAQVDITNPNGGDTPVVYSKDYLRIEESVIEVPVYIKNNHGIMGFGMNFEYDSSVLTPLGVTADSLLSAGYFVNNIGSKYGSFKVLWNHTENIYGNGLLFTIRFSVAEGANPATVPLTVTYSQPDTYNEQWQDVALKINLSEIGISYVYTATFMFNGQIIGMDEFRPDDESLDYPEVEQKPYYNWVWDEHELTSQDITVEGRYVPVEYTITFISNGKTVKTQVYTVETQDSVSLPQLSLPAKEGYYSEWEDFTGKIGNLTVNEIYVAEEYTIYFYCEGCFVSQIGFTVETELSQIDLPEVPDKSGYSGVWEEFTITANDIEVNCIYTPVVYKATFMSGGKVIGTDTFTVEDEALDYPLVEKHECYDWVWDKHSIEAGDITVEGRYVPIEYTITFVSNGKIIETRGYNVETLDLIVPPAKSLPAKQHYTTEWEDWRGKTGNITVNEIYVPVKYTASFYFKDKLVATRSYTVETQISNVTIPAVPEEAGYTIEWPEFTFAYKNQNIYAVYTPVTYIASFYVDGKLFAIRPFTVETEKINEPQVPQKSGFIASWSGYVIGPENLIIHAKYYPPEVVVKEKITLKNDETFRMIPLCNFEASSRHWSSSNPAVATVDSHGNITAVGKGECKITVVCYGKDSSGNDIKATGITEIKVKEQINAQTFKERFRAAFDEFFSVKLYDITFNFKKFIIIFLRHAY